MAKEVKKKTVMTKVQFIAQIAEKHSIPKVKVAEILDTIAEITYENAKNGFTLPGIGKVVVTSRSERMCRNPQTGENIKVPAKRVLKFRFAKAAKDRILSEKKK